MFPILYYNFIGRKKAIRRARIVEVKGSREAVERVVVGLAAL